MHREEVISGVDLSLCGVILMNLCWWFTNTQEKFGEICGFHSKKTLDDLIEYDVIVKNLIEKYLLAVSIFLVGNIFLEHNRVVQECVPKPGNELAF